MQNLYFEAFEKYAPALRLLYPQQLQAVEDALDKYTDTGQLVRIEDSFARLAFMMIVCDEQTKKRRKACKVCKSQNKKDI